MKNKFKNCLKLLFIFMLFFVTNSIYAANRIISLIPSSTELLFAIGFGNEVVAVSNYCNFPEKDICNLPKIGDQNLDLEKIISLNPSILIDTNGIHMKYAETFKNLGLNYINIEIKKQSDIAKAALILGKLLGDETKSNKFVENWNKEIRMLKPIPAFYSPKVYMEIWHTPIQGAGANTNIDDILRLAGGINIFKNEINYPLVNTEMVLMKNPDIIFLIYPNPDIEAVKSRPAWKYIKAVENNNIFAINQDILVRPGPRNIEAIKIMNKIINKVVKNEIN